MKPRSGKKNMNKKKKEKRKEKKRRKKKRKEKLFVTFVFCLGPTRTFPAPARVCTLAIARWGWTVGRG
jgi:hypothetical protein